MVETKADQNRPGMIAIGLIAGLIIIGLLYFLPVAVQGNVIDAANGQPLPDQTVLLDNGQELRTDARGHFRMRASRLEQPQVTVANDGYRTWQGAPAFPIIPLLPASLPVDLQPNRLHGQVLDASNGQPVAGAEVNAGGQTIITNDEGNYELLRFPAGPLELQASADGFIALNRQLPADHSLDASQALDLEILPISLHGVVSDGGTGQGLAGATLSSNGQTVQSNEQGFFYFADSPDATQIEAARPGYHASVVEIASEAARQGLEPVAIALQPTALTGQVKDGQTRKPLAGVTVTAGGQTITTGNGGQYRIERLHGAGLKLAATLEDYEPAEAEIDEGTHLLAGQPLDVILFPPNLAGRVVNQVTGSPVANAVVTAGDLSATTDAEGRFILWTNQVPLQIALQANGYEPARAEFSQDAELSVPLEPRGVVVMVQGSQGQLLSGASVVGPRSQATTDAQGVALLELLEPGDVFTVTAENFSTSVQPFDGASQVTLALFPDTVGGRVLDASTGEGVLGATLYVYDRAACQGENCRGTEPLLVVGAAEDGSFLVDGLPANPQLMVKAPGYSLLFPAELEAGDCGAPFCLEAALEPFEARGFYVPFHFLYDRQLIRSRLDLIAESPILNAVVVDMKSDFGKIAWEPENPIALEIGVHQPDVMSAQEFLAEARQRGIYTIARLVTFKDNALAEGRPEWAIRKKSEPDRLYRDGENLAWVDPYREEVQQYQIDLARELARLGFDELQFDYFRFDGGESLDFIGGAPSRFIFQVESTVDNRRETISSFAEKLMAALKPSGVFTAVDVFGNIILVGREPIIGQDLQEIAVHLDYLSPMIYPQVWGPETFRECGDPALCPYKVIYDSTRIVREIVPYPTRIRPWIQGYPNNYRRSGPAAGYNYAVPEMMIQRQAAEDADTAGWLFWSGGGNFPDEIFGSMPSLAELEAQVRTRQGGRSGPY